MLVLSATLVGAFILMSVLTDNNTDDDDGPVGHQEVLDARQEHDCLRELDHQVFERKF